MEDFKKLQGLSPQDLERGQQEKLARLLRHAYENVPYYRELFQGIGFRSDSPLQIFHALPSLDKRTIRENTNDLIAREPGVLIPNSTGGSTGEKLTFFHDRFSDMRRKAATIYLQEELGVALGEPVASLWGAPMDVDRTQSLRGRLHTWLTNQRTLSTYRMSEKDLGQYYHILNRFHPKLLISYPSPLTLFCEYLQERGLKLPSLKAVVVSAETLYPYQRQIIEGALGCCVFNRYGCREFGDIAHELPCKTGLHVITDRVFLEVLDEQMQPVRPGESGEIFVTDLDNYSMPFIRYRIGDMARTARAESCSCGRGWPLLEEVLGRSFDLVRAPNGNALGGTFWTILFRQRPGIRQFQVRQIARDRLLVSYVTDDQTNSLPVDSLAYWKAKIRDMCGEEMQVEFQCVGEIPQMVSGKTRIVICEIDQARHDVSATR